MSINLDAPDDRYLPGYRKGLQSIGPRLVETRVAFSLYGTPIPVHFGTGRNPEPCNIIWSLPLSERPVTAGAVTQYTYYGTFAVAAGYVGNTASTKRDLLRVWADGRLILDNKQSRRQIAQSFKYRWYDGSEDQFQDPSIIADKGIDNTPAFRGMMYLVILDLPLETFDNKLPVIHVEIGDVTAGAGATTDIPAPGDTDNDTPVYINVDSGKAFVVNNSSSFSGLKFYDYLNGNFVKSVNVNTEGVHQSGTSHDGTGIHNNTHIYAPTVDRIIGIPNFQAVPRNSLIVVDPATGIVTTSLEDAAHQIALLRVGAFNTPSANTLCIASHSVYNDLEFFSYVDGSLRLIHAIESGYSGLFATGWFGKATATSIEYYATTGLDDGLQKFNIPVDSGGVITPTLVSNWLPYSGAGVGVRVSSGMYIELLDAVVVFYTSGEARMVSASTGDEIWSLSGLLRVPSLKEGMNALQSGRNNGRLLIYCSQNTIFEIDLIKGTARTFPLLGNLIASNSATFDEAEKAIYGIGNVDGRLRRVQYELSTGLSLKISDLIEQMAVLNGYQPSDLDIQITVDDEVSGAVFTEPVSFQEFCEMMRTLYGYDIFESGGKLVVKDTYSSVYTPLFFIPQNDIIQSDRPFVEKIGSDTDVARSYTVKYIDPTLGYQWANQTWDRPRDGLVHTSEGTNEITVPIFMSANQAKMSALRANISGVVSTTAYSFGLPYKYLDLEPGDVSRLTINGRDYDIRPVSVTYNEDYTVSVIGQPYIAFENFDLSAYAGQPYVVEIKTSESAHVLPLMIPYLGTGDVPPEGKSIVRYVVYPDKIDAVFTGTFGNVGFWVSSPGTVISNGSVTWSKLEFSDFAVPIGRLVSRFPAPPEGCEHALDKINRINVNFEHGDPTLLTSASFDDIVNGSNIAAVGRYGRFEIIRWMDIALELDGSYTISNMIRGCFNTEHLNSTCIFTDAGQRVVYGSLSKANDFFIPLESEWLKSIQFSVDENKAKEFQFSSSLYGRPEYHFSAGDKPIIQNPVNFIRSDFRGDEFQFINGSSQSDVAGYSPNLVRSEISPPCEVVQVRRDSHGRLSFDIVFSQLLGRPMIDGGLSPQNFRSHETQTFMLFVTNQTNIDPAENREDAYIVAPSTEIPSFNGRGQALQRLSPDLGLGGGPGEIEPMSFVFTVPTGTEMFTFDCPFPIARERDTLTEDPFPVAPGILLDVPISQRNKLAYQRVSVAVARVLSDSAIGPRAVVSTMTVAYTGGAGTPTDYTSIERTSNHPLNNTLVYSIDNDEIVGSYIPKPTLDENQYSIGHTRFKLMDVKDV